MRSTIWALVLLIVLTLGFAVLITALTGAQWDKTDASQRADIRADPVRQILAAGFQLSQLTISYSA